MLAKQCGNNKDCTCHAAKEAQMVRLREWKAAALFNFCLTATCLHPHLKDYHFDVGMHVRHLWLPFAEECVECREG